MKPKIMVWASTITVFVALVASIPLAAQDTKSNNNPHKHVRYTVKVLSTLGGSSGVGNSVNNTGWISGGANLTGDTTEQAALWRNGVITPHGTLGMPRQLRKCPGEKREW